MIELLTDNHLDKILDLFDGAEQNVNIVSPFLTMSMAEKLCEVKEKKNLVCTFITRMYLEDMLAKANSLDALELMLAGATAVSVGTANFANPMVTMEIVDGIEQYMQMHGIVDINELIGAVK